MVLKTMRLFAITLHFLFVAIVGFIGCLFRPFNPHNTYLFGRLLGKMGLLILGIKSSIKNHQGLYTPRPCVFISNHQHNLDILPCSQWISPGTVSLGKKSIRRIPVFGLFYWLAGNVLIDRNNKKSAIQTMDQAVKTINERHVSIWMMPEGTRFRGPGVKEFKKGPFYTAIKAQVPIVPVAFNRYSDHLDLSRLHSTTILAHVHEPISTVGMSIDQVEELALRCHKIISESVEQLNLEAQL